MSLKKQSWPLRQNFKSLGYRITLFKFNPKSLRNLFRSTKQSTLPYKVVLIISVLIGGTNLALADQNSEIEENWLASPHADSSSDSFRHWDEDGEIPVNCATCHSMTGFQDFTGDDGSPAGVIDKPAAIGTVIGCSTCHHEALGGMDSVTFPSGFTSTDTGSSTSCLVCHQGRLSTVQVNEKLDGFDDDTVSDKLGFLNIHYRAAGASLLGSDAKGGYEYAGKNYAGRFAHPEPYNTCAGCHDAHALTVKEESCGTCHAGVNSINEIRLGSADYDGDGDSTSGVAEELSSLHTVLGNAIVKYSTEIAKAPVAYHPHQYPYFFEDLNNDGVINDDEAAYPNRYKHWTPRLTKAAYNYQFVAKDPGIWAHNPRYAAQILIDSIEDLATTVQLVLPELSRP